MGICEGKGGTLSFILKNKRIIIQNKIKKPIIMWSKVLLLSSLGQSPVARKI